MSTTTKQQLEENIKKLENGLSNPALGEQFNRKIKTQIEAAKKQLAELEEAEKLEAKSKIKTIPPAAKKQAEKKAAKEQKDSKATIGKAKEILTKMKEKIATSSKQKKEEPKKVSPSEKAKELALKYRKDQGLSTTKSDVEKDAGRPALPAGKRVTDGTHYPYVKGNVYYENRENRIDRRPKKYPKLQDGGEVDDDDSVLDDNNNNAHEFKIYLDEWEANVYVDDFEEGEGANVNNFSASVRKTFDDVDELVKYISANIVYKDLVKEDFSITDSRIDAALLVDNDNSPADDNEIELWKQGEIPLYSANYSFYIKLVIEKEPTEKELMQMFGYPTEEINDEGQIMARGGIVVSKLSDIPNLHERVEQGKVTYRGLGLGKLSNDFYKIAGTGGTRIKVDGKEYFITDEEFNTISRGADGKMKIRFDAPYRKHERGGYMANGGSIDADRFAKPAGWRWKESAVEEGIVKRASLGTSPSLKMRKQYPDHVYYEDRLTKADAHPSRKYQSLETGGTLGNDGLLHAIKETVSSGTLANIIDMHKLKDIDAVKYEAISILMAEGDRPYSVGNLRELLLEAKEIYLQGKNHEDGAAIEDEINITSGEVHRNQS